MLKRCKSFESYIKSIEAKHDKRQLTSLLFYKLSPDAPSLHGSELLQCVQQHPPSLSRVPAANNMHGSRIKNYKWEILA